MKKEFGENLEVAPCSTAKAPINSCLTLWNPSPVGWLQAVKKSFEKSFEDLDGASKRELQCVTRRK